ncbi:uncharacterized protein LOC135383982 [Ornithodoros turicata]|uniref:uncharacterized protein LOC135383982 n=1 Tax=Ornithodoros turicata TaxID=34597 RepID=UPI00313906E1
MKGLRFCRSLVSAVLDGIEKRFGTLADDKDLLIAAAVIPRFKLSSITDNIQRHAVMDQIKKKLSDISESAPATETRCPPRDSCTEDFFAFAQHALTTASSTEDQELMEFMAHDGRLSAFCNTERLPSCA